MRLSEAERERRSRQAKEMHRRGVLGGTGPAQKSVESRRLKARRASELAQALVVKHAAAIEAALVEALKTGSTNQKIRASEALLKLSLSAERLDVAEDRVESEGRSREELVTALMKSFEGPVGAILARELAKRQGIVNAEAADLIEFPARSAS